LVSAFEDPPRLLDPQSGAPAALRSALEAAENDLPNERQLAALGASLGPLLGGGAPLGGAGPAAAGHAAAHGASGLAAAKLAALVLAAGALIGGGAWLVRRSRATSSQPAAAPAAATGAGARPAVAAPSALAVSAAPAPSTLAHVTPIAARSAPIAKPSAAAPNSSLTEVQLLARAQAALATHPARALALTSEDGRRFPDGALVQEREVIAIQALSELGQHADAVLRARAFEKRFPHSAFQRKVRSALGGD
jgi:hypothetical protein